MVTKDRLDQVLEYSPETGEFRRRVTIKGNKAGSVAGCLDSHGYVVIKIDGQLYKAHRLAFLAMTGAFPPEDVDHLNMVRSDNRWANLRAASRLQNNVNIRAKRHSASRFVGVYWSPQQKAWAARARIRGARPLLGYFETEEAAARAYHAAVKAEHGDFARGNPEAIAA